MSTTIINNRRANLDVPANPYRRSVRRRKTPWWEALLGGLLAVTSVVLLLALAFGIGVVFWSWVIMLVVGAAKPAWGWGFWDAMLPWGILTSLVLSALTPVRSL